MQTVWKNPSPQKRRVMQGLKVGNNFGILSAELNIAQATAEVYSIDCLVAGGDVNHMTMAEYLRVDKRSFEIIKSEIMANKRRNFAPCGTILNKLIRIIKYVLFWHARFTIMN